MGGVVKDLGQILYHFKNKDLGQLVNLLLCATVLSSLKESTIIIYNFHTNNICSRFQPEDKWKTNIWIYVESLLSPGWTYCRTWFYSMDHFFHPFLLKLFLTKDSIYWNKMIFENTSSHSNVSWQKHKCCWILKHKQRLSRKKLETKLTCTCTWDHYT